MNGREADHVADVPEKRCIFWDTIMLFLVSIMGTVLLSLNLLPQVIFLNLFAFYAYYILLHDIIDAIRLQVLTSIFKRVYAIPL